MNDFFSYLSQEVPWFFPTLAWLGSIILVIFILAVPAYFIFLPFFQRIRAQINYFIDRLVDKFKKIRTERANRLDSVADDFLKDGGLLQLKTEAAGNWSELMKDLLNTLKKLHKPLNNVINKAHDLSKKISTLQKQIQQSENTKLQEFTILPEPLELTESVTKIRVAWVRFILSAVVLFGLMIVNTGMLSQILLDLGVIPAGMSFLGLKLAYVFAFILTLVEAGLGVAHGATRSDNPEKVAIFPFVIIIFSIIVACVEGFFYSRVAPTGTFTLPFFDYQMPQNHLFFLWGFVLVMTLFSLGLIAFDSIVVISSGTQSSTLRREMKKLKKHYERYARALKHADEALATAKSTANITDQIIIGPATNAQSINEEIIRVTGKIETLKDTIPEWAKEPERSLIRSEVHELAQKGGIWLLLSFAGFFVIILTGLYAFMAFYPSLPSLLVWVLAIGQSLAFFSVGLLLGTGETIVQGANSERRVITAPHISRLLAYCIASALFIAHVIIFVAISIPAKLGGLWILNFLVGLFLIAVGYQLIHLLIVLPLWLIRIWNSAVIAFQVIWLAIIRIFQFVVIILESLAYLFALTILKLFKSKHQLIDNENLHSISILKNNQSTEKQTEGKTL